MTRKRILVACILAAVSGITSYFWLRSFGTAADADFSWPAAGANALIQGVNPYGDQLYQFRSYPFSAPLFYPLPALFVALPFAAFPVGLAGPLFVAASSALLAYHLTADGWPPLVLFLSAHYWSAALFCQWSPILYAGLFVSALAPLLWLAKPNVGLPLLLVRPPSRYFVAASVAIILISLIILPSWPMDLIRNLPRHQNYIPLLTWPGLFLVLVLLRWRDPRSRLLLGMAAMPQMGWYDLVPLWFIPRETRDKIAIAFLSWIGFFVELIIPSGRLWIVVFGYVPMLVVLFWRRQP